MKTLVVYYSRDGHTRTMAQEMAKALSADLEEIQEMKSREGMLGYLSACKDAALNVVTEIKSSAVNITDYDLVIIGTPIWAFTMCSGVRAWLTQYAEKLQKIAFFATMGGSGDKRAFTQMETLCRKTPVATATFIDKAVAKNQYKNKLDDFLKLLT